MGEKDLLTCVALAFFWPIGMAQAAARKGDNVESTMTAIFAIMVILAPPVWVAGMPFAFLYFLFSD